MRARAFLYELISRPIRRRPGLSRALGRFGPVRSLARALTGNFDIEANKRLAETISREIEALGYQESSVLVPHKVLYHTDLGFLPDVATFVEERREQLEVAFVDSMDLGYYSMDFLRQLEQGWGLAKVIGGVYMWVSKTRHRDMKSFRIFLKILERETRPSSWFFKRQRRIYSRKFAPNLNYNAGGTRGLNVLVISANGLGNLGDDAVTACAVGAIKEALPSSRVLVSRLPVSRRDIIGFDLVVLGGGGIIYDGDVANMANYSAVLAWAKEMGALSGALGIGTQGIQTQIGKEVFRATLSSCLFLTVRDKGDKATLQDACLVQGEITTTQDLAFLIPRYFQPSNKTKENTTKGKLAVGLALVDNNALRAGSRLEGYRKELMRLVEKLLAEDFFPQLVVQSLDDLPLYSEIAALHKLPILNLIGKPLAEVMKIYSDLDIVISSRFHGVVLGLISGCQTYGISGKGSKIHRMINHSCPELRPNLLPINSAFSELIVASILSNGRSEKELERAAGVKSRLTNQAKVNIVEIQRSVINEA